MREDGTCDKCGFVAEDSSLHLFQLHSDRFRLRGMIAYAKAAPTFGSCKSILTDALDGVNGGENYDEVKGEREILRAEVERLKKDAAIVQLARKAIDRLKEREGENPEEWAKRLADDVKDLTD